MAIASADLQLIISAIDNSSGPLRQAAEEVHQLGEAGGGAAGGLTKFGVEAEGAGRKAQESGGLFRGMGESIAEVAKVAAGFALGGIALSAASGVETLFGSITELGHQTHSLQMEIGGTAENVSGMLAVFERWGVTNQQAAVSLGILSKNITQYNDESQKAQNAATGMSGAVDRLHLALKDASGASVSANDALLQIADRFKAMPDGVEKTADAMALFGRSGRDMIPVLNQGRAGIQAAMDTAKQYGLVLSQDNVEAVYKFGQAQRDLSEAVKGFAVQVGVLVLPLLTSLVQGVTSAAETFNTTFLPIIRSVVEYVSNTFGPYIAAGVALAGDAFNALAGVVSGALSSVLSIVVSVGQAIADALSWLDPFATHSPSLVSQVKDGMQQVQDSYAGVTAISGPLAEAGASVQDFADKGKTALKDLVTGTKEQLAAVTDALKDAQTSLTNWGKTPIEGTKAFQDQLDAIDTKSNQVRFAIDQIKLGHDITPQLEALNAQLKEVQLHTVPKGGGSAHTAQVKGIEEQINLLKTSGAQGDLKGLEDQLKNLGLQADAVKLTEKLQLDPLKKQLAETLHPTAAEQPFEVILKGMQAAQAAIATLTPQQAHLNDLLKAQQGAATAAAGAIHAAAGAHTALGGASAGVAATFKDLNKGIDEGKAKIAEWGAKVNDAHESIMRFADRITGPVVAAFNALKGYLDPSNKIDLMGSIFGHDLGAGIDAVVRGYESAFAGVVDIITHIKTALSGGNLDIGAIVKDALNYPVAILTGWGGLAIGIAKAIINGLPEIVSALGQIGTVVLAWITGEVAPIRAQVTTWATAFTDWASTAIANARTQLPLIGAAILTAITDQVAPITAQVAKWAQAFTDWVTPAIVTARAQLPLIGAAILAEIDKQTDPIRAKVAGWATAFSAWVGPAAVQFLKDWPVILNGVLDQIAAAVAPILVQMGKWAIAFGAWLGPAVAQFLQAWPAILNSILDTIAAAVVPIALQLGKWALAFVAWIVPNIPSILQALAQVALVIGIFIVETAVVLGLKLLQWGLELVKWVAPQIPGLLSELRTLLVNVTNWINDQAASIARAAMSWGLAMIKGMIDGLAGFTAQLVAYLTSALSSAQLNLGPIHLDVGLGAKGATGTGTDSSLGLGKSAPSVVTNNTPITVTQTFTGNPNPSDVQSGTHAGLTQALRAAGMH